MDKSNGYEKIASLFIQYRGQAVDGIGTPAVRQWVRSLPVNASVLDIGCGTGLPLTKILIDEGKDVWGIDASPSLVKTFRKNFPDIPVACESVEDSGFFERKFDGAVAWGLMFLLSEESQLKVIQKIADVLNEGGRFLFTAPDVRTTWQDVMTGETSQSLGRDKYKELLSLSGLSLIEEFEDEGENHYFSTVKR